MLGISVAFQNTLHQSHTFSEAGLTASGLAEDGTARRAKDNGLRVAEDSANVQATCVKRPLDIDIPIISFHSRATYQGT